MSQTFIAAYDGTDAARTAVQLTVQLASAQDAEVSAVHVYARVPTAGIRGGVFDPEFEAGLREDGRELLDALDVEGIAHRVLLLGTPAQALHEMAEREEASLLAVGATHHGQLGRLVPGSVGSKLLHGAPCPVLVAPAAPAPGPIRRIVTAYDDSEQAEVALREAVRLATLFGARLEVVGVHDPGVYAGPAMVASHDLDNILRGELRERVEGRVQSITGVDVGTYTEIGDAGRMISRAAEGADLLVTGSRGFGPLHSVLVGSVSRHLVDHAPCPVLVLPRVAAGAGWAGAQEDATAQPADL